MPGSARELPATVATTRVSGGYGPEVDHACADAEFDAGHAAARPALWSHRTGRKVQQLSIVGDEDELGLHGCQFHRTNHPVAGLEANHIPRVLAEYFRVDLLHHTSSCAKRQAERIIGQCGQAERLLSGVQGHQLTDVSAPWRFGAWAVIGTVGRSSALILISLPALVIRPHSPRAVEMILETMRS